jgi:hypothetical protein
MYELLKKLNTLVSAQVNDLASRLPTIERRPDLDRQVAELRQRVAAALEHEDRLRAQVNALQQEIAGLDGRIDAAIQAGHETTARGLLDETQRLQKRLSMAESDLRQHQNAAADLIIRVNELESAVGDLKATQTSTPPPAARAAPPDAPTGAVTDFMPPAEQEPVVSKGTRSSQTPLTDEPEPDNKTPATPAAPVEDRPMETGEVAPPADQPSQPPTQPDQEPQQTQPHAPEKPERKPWDKPRTAKEAAEWAREDAEKTSERANTGVEQVGGLLRDIQARVSQRMTDLDRMLTEGGLIGDEADAPPAPKDKSKPNQDDDLNDRLSRLAKPE